MTTLAEGSRRTPAARVLDPSEVKEQLHMRAPRDPRSAEAVEAFTEIMGRGHVLTSARATAPYTTGDRFGAGEVLAVLRPGSLVDMWRALQVCVDHDLIVITQAANTGLTGGSGPGDQDCDRDIVIISTLRIAQIDRKSTSLNRSQVARSY